MAYSFDGEFTVNTPRDEVYAVLSQTQNFAPMLPSYKTHALNQDGSTDVEVGVGVGKIRGTGKVNLVLEENQPPVHARYLGKGQVMGGAFNIVAAFDLEDAGEGKTKVKWHGELSMFGKLVSLAGGLVKPVAERDINQMITAIQTELGGAEVPVAAPAAAAPRPGLFARFLGWLKSLFGGGTTQ